MKKILIFFVFLVVISITSIQAITPLINKNGTLVPFDEKLDNTAGFIPTNEGPQKGSISYYYRCLGYLDGEVDIYCNDINDIFALNAFNNDVIYVMLGDTIRKPLTVKDVSVYMRGYKPNAVSFARNLKEGVDNGSIRQSFIENALGIITANNTLVDDIHGYTYTFKNGILLSYRSNGGLSDDATYVKEIFPEIYDKISTNAHDYYGTSKSASLEFINGQCKYFLRISTNYIRQAYDSNINYNFALLYCIMYEGMKLDEFLFLVPNSTILSSYDNYVIMSCANYMFTFKDNVHIK